MGNDLPNRLGRVLMPLFAGLMTILMALVGWSTLERGVLLTVGPTSIVAGKLVSQNTYKSTSGRGDSRPTYSADVAYQVDGRPLRTTVKSDFNRFDSWSAGQLVTLHCSNFDPTCVYLDGLPPRWDDVLAAFFVFVAVAGFAFITWVGLAALFAST